MGLSGCLFGHQWRNQLPDICQRCGIRRDVVEPEYMENQYARSRAEYHRENRRETRRREIERQEWNRQRQEAGRGWDYDNRIYDPQIREKIREKVYGKGR